MPGIELVDIFVAADFRGQGVGRQLFAALKEQCLAEEGGWIKWRYDVPNQEAIAFYEKLGGEFPEEERLGYLWLL